MKIVLFFITFSLFSYQAKVVFIDNNFEDLRKNNIKKVIYLSSEIDFELKKGTEFNLYRDIDKDVLKNSSAKWIEKTDNTDNSNLKEDILPKKVCVVVLRVISVVENLIKASEVNNCKDNNSQILGEFQKSKVNDYIEIETILDLKNRKKDLENKLAEAFTGIYMLGIDDDFNYLLEAGLNEINKPLVVEKEIKIEKNLPRKKKKIEKTKKNNNNSTSSKKKKGKKRKTNFESIRL